MTRPYDPVEKNPLIIGKGGTPPRPVNAPDGIGPAPGIQPGQSVPVTLQTITGAVTIFVQGTAPAPPPPIPVNSIWINTANGSINNWNGSSWVTQTFNAQNLIQAGTIVASLIQANTITAAQLAAGIIYAGIVNGTTITSATEFTYNGTPAAGNLTGSRGIVTAGSDSFGNAYLTGDTEYNATAFLAVQIANGRVAFYSATSEAGPWTLASAWDGENFTSFTSPMTFAGAVSVQDYLEVLAAAAPAAISGASLLYSSTTTGYFGEVSQSATWGLLRSQTDISTHSVGNVATAGDITKSWPVPAHDGTTGTVYTVKAFAAATIGATTAETLTIGIDVGGTQTALATLGASFNSSLLSATYGIPLELSLMVGSGSTAQEVVLNGPLGQTSANRLATNSANMSGRSISVAWNPAVANTIAIYAQWGGAGGTGQNIQTLDSRFIREGP